jgi:hypothetical protein
MSEPFPKQGGRFQSCIAHDSHILSFIFTETGVPGYGQHSAHFFILHSYAVVFSFYCPPDGAFSVAGTNVLCSQHR